jgi:hypothetical protein
MMMQVEAIRCCLIADLLDSTVRGSTSPTSAYVSASALLLLLWSVLRSVLTACSRFRQSS